MTVWIVVGCLGVGLLLHWPVRVHQSVNYEPAEWSIPLYVKAIHFMSRSFAFRRLVKEITAGWTTEQEKAEAILNWMGQHVHSGVPKGLPVVDDHVFDVITRRYGTDDQLVDLFAVLCLYAGVSAQRIHLSAPSDPRRRLAACAVKIDGRWRFVDPYHRVAPRDETGTWFAIEDLLSDVTPATQQATAVVFRGLAYAEYLEGLEPVREKAVPRAWKQVPTKRLWYELGQLWEGVRAAPRVMAAGGENS